MCELCGCGEFTKGGQETIRNRAVEIINQLQLNLDNLDDYECTETISGMMAPFALRQDEVYQAASWISGLHQGGKRDIRESQYQAYVRAFQDIFSRLPVRGESKEIGTTYHQLEQLARQVDEQSLSALAPQVQAIIHAVNDVHQDKTRQSRLRERYGLNGF